MMSESCGVSHPSDTGLSTSKVLPFSETKKGDHSLVSSVFPLHQFSYPIPLY